MNIFAIIGLVVLGAALVAAFVVVGSVALAYRVLGQAVRVRGYEDGEGPGFYEEMFAAMQALAVKYADRDLVVVSVKDAPADARKRIASGELARGVEFTAIVRSRSVRKALVKDVMDASVRVRAECQQRMVAGQTR